MREAGALHGASAPASNRSECPSDYGQRCVQVSQFRHISSHAAVPMGGSGSGKRTLKPGEGDGKDPFGRPLKRKAEAKEDAPAAAPAPA